MKTLLPITLALAVTACATGDLRQSDVPSSFADPVAVAYAGDELMVVRGAGSRCVAATQGSDASPIDLPFCPDRVEAARNDGWLFSNASRAALFDPAGRAVQVSPEVIAVGAAGQVLRRMSPTRAVWIETDLRLELPFLPIRARFLKSKQAFVAIRESAGGVELVRVNSDGSELVLVDGVAAIDSFDLAPSELEIAFSASRSGNFDVGLVSSDGSEVNWLPSEVWPELKVRWAPRGNKFTYSVESPAASYLRTVHVPTSFQLMIDLDLSDVTDLAWHPAAERFAIVRSGPTFSPRVDRVRYSGDDMETLLSSRVSLDSEAQVLPGGTILLQPPELSYAEKRPLVVFEVSDPRGWHEPAAVAVEAGAAVVVGRSADSALLSVSEQLGAAGWIDPARVYVVGDGSREDGALRRPGLTLIYPSSASLSRERGDVVMSGDPELFQDQLTEYLRRELTKGSSATHGRS